MPAWNDSMKIGIPEIDQQHKQLIDQMDLLVQALRNNQGKAEVQKIVSFLEVYVNEHFGFEEECMHRYRCPVASQNKNAHQKFIQNLREIQVELKHNEPSLLVVLKVNENLLDWFINHIRKIDTQLQPCMMNGVPSSRE
ncbi:bacteriohemerythrin [Spirulina subsalsa]|nr:hemerythrin family protein [Spirulina subsalsa]